MQFNVSGLMLEGIGATRVHSVDGFLKTPERTPERIAGDVHLLRTNDGVLATGHFKLVDPENCSRCLEPLEETLAIDFEEEFLATVDPRTGTRLDWDEDEKGSIRESFLIDERHILDLTEAVRQYREANADMQPLCRPDCRGLCPVCGTNLNSSSCHCEDGPLTAAGPRWPGSMLGLKRRISYATTS